MGMVYRLKSKKGERFGTEHGTGKSEEQNNFWSKATEFKGLVPHRSLDGTYCTQKTLLVRWPSLIGESSTQKVMGMCNGLAKGVRTIQAPIITALS